MRNKYQGDSVTDWMHYVHHKKASIHKKKLCNTFLKYYSNIDELDKELIPYLFEINNHSNILTLFSCTGHPKRGYLWLESMLDSEITEKDLIVPLSLDLGVPFRQEYDPMRPPFKRGEIYYMSSISHSTGVTFDLRWSHKKHMKKALDNLINRLSSSENFKK